MVCSRCKMIVQAEFEKAGLRPTRVALGEVDVPDAPTVKQREQLQSTLQGLGFELIEDKVSRIIEKIKNAIVERVHYSDTNAIDTLSSFLAGKIGYDYNYLSNLFSETEGITIEKYFIAQRIEKVKELLMYDELSLSQIAHRLGYSSVAYLSNQFKKETGLTPSFFRGLKEKNRRNIEDL